MTGLVISPVPLTTMSKESCAIGDWYWVKYKQSWGKKANEEQEDLMCVEHIGSNFVEFGYYARDGECGIKVHFNDFFKTCRPEPNWREIVMKRADEAQRQIREKTQRLIDRGRELCLLQQKGPERPPEDTLLPVRVTVDPKHHKQELIELQKFLPEVVKEIEEHGKELAAQYKNLSYPEICKMNSVAKSLEIVNDRIFTIELYCGLQEQIVQIAQGAPAPEMEPIAIRQQLLYMDEETLFNYDEGGMDFKHLSQFDEWIVKSENLNRLLPEQRGIVAFQVRRYKKDYGPCLSLNDVWTQFHWDEANLVTYLLIRNGGNVYRIASSVDFAPRLIPKTDEIGEAQFKLTCRKWMSDEVTETIITPNDIEYDQHVDKLDKLIQHYNRIVILIQGLLDRSAVFLPHPVINLRKADVMETWLRIVRDEEKALPPMAMDWPTYQGQLNSTLKVGKWVFVDGDYECNTYPNRFTYRHGSMQRIKQDWYSDGIPCFLMVQKIRKDKSMVLVTWPKGHCRGRWVYNCASGESEWCDTTDRMCREWVPTKFVLNASDYTGGDYKLFLAHHEMKKEYIKWAKYVLNCENWARRRVNGIAPEDDPKAKSRPR